MQVSVSLILHIGCLICLALFLALVLEQCLAHNKSSVHTWQGSEYPLDKYNLERILYFWNRYPNKIIFLPLTFLKVDVSIRDRFYTVMQEKETLKLRGKYLKKVFLKRCKALATPETELVGFLQYKVCF